MDRGLVFNDSSLMNWSGVDDCDFYQLFGLSFWRHPFTASEGMLHFPKSVLMKKHLWRSDVEYISRKFSFLVNYSFKCISSVVLWMNCMCLYHQCGLVARSDCFMEGCESVSGSEVHMSPVQHQNSNPFHAQTALNRQSQRSLWETDENRHDTPAPEEQLYLREHCL